MKDAIRHLDKRFASLRPLAKDARPPKGWLRAIRDALGMTTAQFARRLGVSQPRIIELEQSEGIYIIEKQFMDAIRQSVTESLVNQMFART